VVYAALSLGALVGVLLSGGFIFGEIGRFATPQVPETLFEERREVFAYTVGLFVGVVLALPFLFYLQSMFNGALPGALIWLAVLVGATEAAQWIFLRTVYFGHLPASPFYALGYRAGIGGILILALVTLDLGSGPITVVALSTMILQSFAILALEVAGALLSLRAAPGSGRTGGGPLSGALIGLSGFFLIGFAQLLGDEYGAVAAVLALVGGVWVYSRLRPELAAIPPPGGATAPPVAPLPSSYGRIDR
jgi:hypothetical protein